MSSFNKVILIGNLGKDPEVRYLENNVPMAKFSLATGESWKDKNTGERKEQTEWHNIVVWRQSAEYAEKFLHKGDKVLVEGRLKTRKWEDKEGNQRHVTEIVADTVRNLTPRKDYTAQAPSETPAHTAEELPSAKEGSSFGGKETESVSDTSDDLPF